MSYFVSLSPFLIKKIGESHKSSYGKIALPRSSYGSSFFVWFVWPSVAEYMAFRADLCYIQFKCRSKYVAYILGTNLIIALI